MKKETTIEFDDNNEEAAICSGDEKWWKLMERLAIDPINIFYNADDSVHAKEYLFPSRWILIKKRKELTGEAFERGKKGSERVSKLLQKSKNKDII